MNSFSLQYHIFNGPSNAVILTNYLKGYTQSCSESLNIPVNVLLEPVSDFILPDNSSLIADFTDNSMDATMWDWDFGDGNIDNVQNPTNTYGANGTYDVTLTASNAGCSNSITKTVVFSVGIEGFDLNKGTSIYPNPVSDNLNLEFSNQLEGKKKVEIYNILGEKVIELEFNGMSKSVDVSSLSKGKYLIKVELYDKTYTRTFVKQ